MNVLLACLNVDVSIFFLSFLQSCGWFTIVQDVIWDVWAAKLCYLLGLEIITVTKHQNLICLI